MIVSYGRSEKVTQEEDRQEKKRPKKNGFVAQIGPQV
jgi:hypothetical protein